MTTKNVAAGLSKVGQISVRAKDLERGVAFYRDVLGMKFLFQVPRLAFFDCDGVRLMLDVVEGAEFDHPSSIIYFTVKDIQESFERLRQRGAQFRTDPHVNARMESYDVWMAFFWDSEENVLALMSEVPH